MKDTFEHKEIMELIDDTCKENFSRKLEIFLRKESILSFILGKQEVLDVGCGEGVLSIYLARRGHKVTAIDNGEASLKSALALTRKYSSPVNFQLGLAEKLNFSNDAFDLVIYEEVLEHLKEPLAALQEARRVLRPKGKIIFSVPNFKSLRARMFKILGLEGRLLCPDHKQNFNLRSITDLVNRAGFKIITQTSDFIPIPKLALNMFLEKRMSLAQKFPFLGHHLIIYAEKQ